MLYMYVTLLRGKLFFYLTAFCFFLAEEYNGRKRFNLEPWGYTCHQFL